MVTLKTSDFRPAYKNKSTSTTHTTKPISSLHWNQVKFDPLHWNEVNMDHPHKNQVNFHAHHKNKWFSASIQATSQFLPPTQPNQFHPYTEIRSSSIRHTEKKPISTITKNKSISMLTLKTSDFQSAHKSKVDFDPHTKSQFQYSP